jgi:hypothetical protein
MISKTSCLLFCSCANPVCVQTDSVDLMQKMSSVDQFLALSSQQMWCQAMQTTGYSARSQDGRDTNRWDIEIQIYVSQRAPRHKLCVQKPCTLRAILDCTTTKVKHACAGKWFPWDLEMQWTSSQLWNSWSLIKGMQEFICRNPLPSNVLTLVKSGRK